MNDLQPDNILIYRADDDRFRLEVKLENQSIWLSQKQIGELYQKSKASISEHIKNIFQDGELDPRATVRKFRTVQKEGDRRVEKLQKSKVSISEHIKHIFEDGELDENSVVRNFRTTAADRKNYVVQAKRKVPMRMIDWLKKLDGFLELNERNILEHAGKISHEMALQAAGKEYEKYCEIQKQAVNHLESDFDKAVKQLMGKKVAEDS